MKNKTTIVVVGGGAGGLELVRKLASGLNRRTHDVVLVDRDRTHVWKPLLHEVAAGALDANLDEVSFLAHSARWGYRYFNGTLQSVDRTEREITLGPQQLEGDRNAIVSQSIRYDYLVFAIGSVTNDFGTPGVKDNCLYLDCRAQADRFRETLLDNCLRVSRARIANPEIDAKVRVAIVGAGATGVELAAELYNSARALGTQGLAMFDETRLEVTILEAAGRVLPALAETLSSSVHQELEKLGVRILTKTRVTGAGPSGISIASGDLIAADIQVWAAGIKGASIAGPLEGISKNSRAQFEVRETLQLFGEDRIFALGDCASCTLPGLDGPVPPRAQAAHQMADIVYANVIAQIRKKPLRSFDYKDHGSLVSMSRFTTFGNLMGGLFSGSLAVQGRIARFFYSSLYSMHLIAIHGLLRGAAMIALGRVNRVIRPKMKLH